MTTEVLVCDCNNVEHNYTIMYDVHPEFKEVYISPHLKTVNFLERLKRGIKYIFGHKSKFGDFDEIVITKENYMPLKHIVEYLESTE